MEHSITMLAHREPELFSQLVQAASERLEIPIYLVEKDYYISLILNFAELPQCSNRVQRRNGLIKGLCVD